MNEELLHFNTVLDDGEPGMGVLFARIGETEMSPYFISYYFVDGQGKEDGLTGGEETFETLIESMEVVSKRIDSYVRAKVKENSRK